LGPDLDAGGVAYTVRSARNHSVPFVRCDRLPSIRLIRIRTAPSARAPSSNVRRLHATGRPDPRARF